MRLSALVLVSVLVPTTVFAAADVGVVLSDGVLVVDHGHSVPYDLTVTNNGPDTATAAHVAIALSPELTLTAASCTDETAAGPCTGTFDDAGLIYDGDIPAGTTLLFQFAGTVSSTATQVVTSAAVSGAYGETNPENDTGVDTDVAVYEANLAITASGPTTVNERSAYAYTINVGNLGPEAPQLSVVAQLSGGATFASVDGGIFTCTLSDSTDIQCTGTPPAAAGTTPIIVNVVAPVGDATVTMTTTYTNTNIDDPTPANNEPTKTTFIQGINDAPVITAPISITSPYNGTATFANDNAIAITDIDAGGDGLQVRLQTTHGTLTLGSITGLSFTNGTGTSDTVAIFSGSQSALTTAFDGAVFSPVQNFHGTATLSIIVDDLGHNGVGGALQDQWTVSILAGESDSDHDGLSDDGEITFGTDPYDDDSDDDGIIDGREDLNRNGQVDDGETNPNNVDSDADGLLDGLEVALAGPQGHDTNLATFVADQDISSHTDPTNADTDGGGKADGLEDANHDGAVQPSETDPNNPRDDVPKQTPPDEGDTDTPDAPIVTAGGNGCAADGASPLMLIALLGLVRRRKPS